MKSDGDFEVMAPDFETHTPDSGPIWVTQFTENSARTFVDDVMRRHLKDPTEPLIVYINSYGGEVDALLSMVDALDGITNPLITVCIGKAMSCGAILFSHGDARFMGRNARAMIHEVSGGAVGNVVDVEQDVNELRRIHKVSMALLARNCGKAAKDLHKLFREKRDIYLDAKAAVEFGLADMIGIPVLNKSVVYDIALKRPLNPERFTRKSRKPLTVDDVGELLVGELLSAFAETPKDKPFKNKLTPDPKPKSKKSKPKK
jgi:ATP-dependent Clp protease protease subunit